MGGWANAAEHSTALLIQPRPGKPAIAPQTSQPGKTQHSSALGQSKLGMRGERVVFGGTILGPDEALGTSSSSSSSSSSSTIMPQSSPDQQSPAKHSTSQQDHTSPALSCPALPFPAQPSPARPDELSPAQPSFEPRVGVWGGVGQVVTNRHFAEFGRLHTCTAFAYLSCPSTHRLAQPHTHTPRNITPHHTPHTTHTQHNIGDFACRGTVFLQRRSRFSPTDPNRSMQGT